MSFMYLLNGNNNSNFCVELGVHETIHEVLNKCFM